MESLHAFAASLPKWSVIPVLVATLTIYLLPTFIALARGRNDVRKIAAVNLISGLSWPAWVATFVWAFSGTRPTGTDEVKGRRRFLTWPVGIGLLIGVTIAARYALG